MSDKVYVIDRDYINENIPLSYINSILADESYNKAYNSIEDIHKAGTIIIKNLYNKLKEANSRLLNRLNISNTNNIGYYSDSDRYLLYAYEPNDYINEFETVILIELKCREINLN